MIQLGDEVIWPEAEESHYHEHFMVLNIYPSHLLKNETGQGVLVARS